MFKKFFNIISKIFKKDRNEVRDSLEYLIDISSEMIGPAYSSVVGSTIGGTEGTLFAGAYGSVITNSLKMISNNFLNRYLPIRRQQRVGTALFFAVEKLNKKIEAGATIRDDDYFEKKENGRSSAEEIIEGILESSQKEHEEKKLKLFGNLIANLAIHKEIDKSQANFFIKLSESLTFRQLCILRFFGGFSKTKLRTNDYRSISRFKPEFLVLLQEIFDMYSKGLINGGGDAWLGITDVNPSNIQLQGAGVHLHNLMELHEIDIKDLMDFIICFHEKFDPKGLDEVTNTDIVQLV